MIGINTYSSGARAFVGKNIAEMVAATGQSGASFKESLAAVSVSLDELSKAGLGVEQGLAKRESRISGLLNDIEEGARLGLIDDLPDALRFETDSGIDPLISAIDSVRSSGAQFNAAQDSAMDGVLLLDRGNPDALVDRLKAASSYWSNDLISRHGDAIEATLRSPEPVNADAAALLGQPVATAEIPMGITKKGVDYSPNHIVPDRILSPPQGFASRADARAATLNFLESSPGSSTVAFRMQGQGGVHLLSAPIDTSRRSLRYKRALRGETLKDIEVRLSANHPDVMAMWRSDNTHVYRNSDGFRSSAWPEGHLWPLTGGDLKAAGLASEHRSIRAMVEPELVRTQAARNEAADLVERLIRQREVVRTARMDIEKFGEIIDLPGEGNPLQWETETAFTLRNEPVVFSFSAHNDGFAKALPGYSIEDAVHYAANREIHDPTKMTVVMQDSSGTPHLVDIPQQFPMTDPGTGIHPDLRAILDPAQGKIWYRFSESQSNLTSMRIDLSEAATRQLQTAFDEISKNKPFAGAATYAPINEHLPIMYLPQTDARAAALHAANLAKRTGGNTAWAMVKAQNPQGTGESYGLVRVLQQGGTPYTTWQRNYKYAKNAGSSLQAAIDASGIAYLRGGD